MQSQLAEEGGGGQNRFRMVWCSWVRVGRIFIVGRRTEMKGAGPCPALLFLLLALCISIGIITVIRGAQQTRTRTNTNPNDTEANAAGRSVRACVARKSKS